MKTAKEKITIWSKTGRMAIGEYEGTNEKFAVLQFSDEDYNVEVKFRPSELIKFRDHVSKLLDYLAEDEDNEGYIIVD